MATTEMYEKIKHLSKDEIIEIAKHCCGDIYQIYPTDEELEAEAKEKGISFEELLDQYEVKDFCQSKCPYLDVREEEENPNRFCRQWVMHDLIKMISK
jgi:NH3-dependent NAD+ synthetase